jgi:hypothetical protein
VRVDLRHDAVVDVEELAQTLRGEVGGDGAVLPAEVLVAQVTHHATVAGAREELHGGVDEGDCA